MGGQLFNADAQAGGCTAKALRAKAGCIDGIQQLFFQRGIIGVRVGLVQRAQQCLFGQSCAFIKAAANANAQHNGRAGVGPRLLDGFHHKVFYALHAIGRFEHGQAAHILAACALGGYGNFADIPRHKMYR